MGTVERPLDRWHRRRPRRWERTRVAGGEEDSDGFPAKGDGEPPHRGDGRVTDSSDPVPVSVTPLRVESEWRVVRTRTVEAVTGAQGSGGRPSRGGPWTVSGGRQDHGRQDPAERSTRPSPYPRMAGKRAASTLRTRDTKPKRTKIGNWSSVHHPCDDTTDCT